MLVDNRPLLFLTVFPSECTTLLTLGVDSFNPQFWSITGKSWRYSRQLISRFSPSMKTSIWVTFGECILMIIWKNMRSFSTLQAPCSKRLQRIKPEVRQPGESSLLAPLNKENNKSCNASTMSMIASHKSHLQPLQNSLRLKKSARYHSLSAVFKKPSDCCTVVH